MRILVLTDEDFETLDRIERKLDRALLLLGAVHREQIMTQKDLDAAVATLTADAAILKDKDESILSYVKGVPKAMLDAVAAAEGDNAVAVANINALAASLAASPDAILAAINANTTPAAAPAPAPAPVDAPPAAAPPADAAPAGEVPPATT